MKRWDIVNRNYGAFYNPISTHSAETKEEAALKYLLSYGLGVEEVRPTVSVDAGDLKLVASLAFAYAPFRGEIYEVAKRLKSAANEALR